MTNSKLDKEREGGVGWEGGFRCPPPIERDQVTAYSKFVSREGVLAPNPSFLFYALTVWFFLFF